MYNLLTPSIEAIISDAVVGTKSTKWGSDMKSSTFKIRIRIRRIDIRNSAVHDDLDSMCSEILIIRIRSHFCRKHVA